jgi:hypothetical protein
LTASNLSQRCASLVPSAMCQVQHLSTVRWISNVSRVAVDGVVVTGNRKRRDIPLTATSKRLPYPGSNMNDDTLGVSRVVAAQLPSLLCTVLHPTCSTLTSPYPFASHSLILCFALQPGGGPMRSMLVNGF